MIKARAGIALATVVVAFTACGSIGSVRTQSQSPAPLRFGAPPPGLSSFYGAPDPMPDAAPGTLFKSEKVAAPYLHGTRYRVMYASRSLQGKPVAVTGIVVVPTKPAPADGYRVVTWAHGTTGLGDQCAPSISPNAAPPPSNDLLDQGWVLAESDYSGAGTPGVMPYLAGVSAARNAIDIVRAAHELKAVHTSNQYVVWGYSQGGQAAMFAHDIGNAYAPELRLEGVVAGAPPSQFVDLYSHLKTSSHSYYLLMLVVGLNAEYGNTVAPLGQVLTRAGMALVPTLRNRCVSLPGRGLKQPVRLLLQTKLAGASIAKTFKADPFTLTKWRRVLTANDPQYLKTVTSTPLLIVQGTADDQVPPRTAEDLAMQQCAGGQNVELWMYPGQNHGWALVLSIDDVKHWISDRFAGDASPDGYAPKRIPHITHAARPTTS